MFNNRIGVVMPFDKAKTEMLPLPKTVRKQLIFIVVRIAVRHLMYLVGLDFPQLLIRETRKEVKLAKYN